MFVVIAAVAMLADPPAPARPVGNSEFLRKNYPPSALRRGEQGIVAFEASVEPDGFMSSCKIVRSSGFTVLDRGTCEFLVMHAKFPKVATNDGKPVAAVHQGSINWRLPDGKTAAVASSAVSRPPLTLICKRFRKTGTKVAFVRQCLTESEWGLRSQTAQEDLRRLQDPGGVIPSGPDCRPRC